MENTNHSNSKQSLVHEKGKGIRYNVEGDERMDEKHDLGQMDPVGCVTCAKSPFEVVFLNPRYMPKKP